MLGNDTLPRRRPTTAAFHQKVTRPGGPGIFAGEGAFATWEEAELMEISMVSVRGTADVEALGVKPRSMAEVLRG